MSLEARPTNATPSTPESRHLGLRLIGVFDSGVGGLSVLRALQHWLPAVEMVYFADSAHAPYGERDPIHVRSRTERVVDHLIREGADLVVIACNTATAWAIDAMRKRHPGVPIVGVEPGVKPAAAESRAKRIAVMATPATLASERYADLLARHAAGCDVIPIPCAGLAAAIERGDQGRDEVQRLLDRYCSPLSTRGIDTVVLGCTHYPFVGDEIAVRLGAGIRVIDTADAVARHVSSLRAGIDVRHQGAALTSSALRLQTTGAPDALRRMAQAWLAASSADVSTVHL
jgi:glutamate racemase